MNSIADLIYALDIVGTFVFAISGVLTAVQKRFDFVGAVIIGAVTALGGGTTRDVLIGATPVGWMNDTNYLIVIAAAILVCYLFYNSIIKLRKSMFLFDAIGIGLFTVLGIQKTLSLGLSPAIAILMGIISAVFGGIVRDVLTNEVPLIFRKEIYAMACFTGGLVYLIGTKFLDSPYLVAAISIIIVTTIRILAVRMGWEFPFRPKSFQE